jgi:rhodanese-related sulfurtransferase
MATVVRQSEYDESSVDVAGALDYFQRKMAFTTGPVELSRAIENREVYVVDVRLEHDYRAGHIAGATNLPQDRWQTFDGLVNDRPNVLVCYSHVCHLAAHAAVVFAQAGYPVMELDGGWKEWQRHNLPIERETQ